MTGRRRLLDHDRGASAIEFALAAPVLLAFVFVTVQLGMLFFANADMRNAVGAGARVASIFPRPDDSRIIEHINAGLVGLEPEYVRGPTLVHGTDPDDNEYVEISISYAEPIDFIFFKTGPITLNETRRVFTQPSRN